MRTHLAAVLAASLLFTGSAIAFAAQAQTHKPASTHVAADKTMAGTVKSIDTNKLVLKTKKGEMTFSMGATKVENITAGSTVQVHYRSQGKDHVVTSVMPMATPTAKK